MQMSEKMKLLTKDYFNCHPVKAYSAARLMYSLLLMPEVIEAVDEVTQEVRRMAAESRIDIPNESEAITRVQQEEDIEKLLRMLRQPLPARAHQIVREKLLKRESEALPEIRRMILRSLNDHVIENAAAFMTACSADCVNWIVEHYGEIRSPYAQSMMCLVLGFRADENAMPFLMQQVASFETRYPDETFDQGPLMALYELRARFQAGGYRRDSGAALELSHPRRTE